MVFPFGLYVLLEEAHVRVGWIGDFGGSALWKWKIRNHEDTSSVACDLLGVSLRLQLF
jgi:hypothetical protein